MSMKHRFESFGGVLALEDPPMLVHVDRDFMRGLGCEESPLWEKAGKYPPLRPAGSAFLGDQRLFPAVRRLLHGFGERDAGEMTGDAFRKAIDLLAEMGVFHIAMGGGEALERPDFFELAAYVRSLRHRPQPYHERTSVDGRDRCKVPRFSARST